MGTCSAFCCHCGYQCTPTPALLQPCLLETLELVCSEDFLGKGPDLPVSACLVPACSFPLGGPDQVGLVLVGLSLTGGSPLRTIQDAPQRPPSGPG